MSPGFIKISCSYSIGGGFFIYVFCTINSDYVDDDFFLITIVTFILICFLFSRESAEGEIWIYD